MDVQKLNILLEALRCGSLSRAAEELGYTQSGLTYIMNSFEKELGFPIIIRDTNGVRLSGEGRELLPYIEELIACDRKFTNYAKEMLNRHDNVLNIAAYPSISASWLPRILRDFRRKNPLINVHVRVGGRDKIVDWLSEGVVDFGFAGQIHLTGCEWFPLREDPDVAVLPRSFPTENMQVFPVAEFKNHPFVSPCYWAEESPVRDLLSEYSIEPQITVDSADNVPAIAIVGQGLALSIMPALTVLRQQDRVKTLPLDPPCSRLLGVNYRLSGADASAREFLRCLDGREDTDWFAPPSQNF